MEIAMIGALIAASVISYNLFIKKKENQSNKK